MTGPFIILVGFLIMFGAVGTIDYDPNANLLLQGSLALLGAAISWLGTVILNREKL